MRFFIVIIMIFSFVGSLQSARYINGIEDIPIFKNMVYVEDSLVLFDKTEGRYVSSEIIGDYDQQEIMTFYSLILPNLGWKNIGPYLFKRGNEKLEIKFFEKDRKTSATFNIYPSK